MAGMRAETVNSIIADACPPGSYPEQWDVEGMKARLANVLELSPPIDDWLNEDEVDSEIFENRIQDMADAAATGKAAQVDLETWRGIEKRSEEHTSELQSLMRISYAVFCLKTKKQ